MSIIVNVDVMLAKRKMTSGELAEKVGITAANLSATPIVKMAPIVVTQDNLSDITEDMRW